LTTKNFASQTLVGHFQIHFWFTTRSAVARSQQSGSLVHGRTYDHLLTTKMLRLGLL